MIEIVCFAGGGLTAIIGMLALFHCVPKGSLVGLTASAKAEVEKLTGMKL